MLDRQPTLRLTHKQRIASATHIERFHYDPDGYVRQPGSNSRMITIYLCSPELHLYPCAERALTEIRNLFP